MVSAYLVLWEAHNISENPVRRVAVSHICHREPMNLIDWCSRQLVSCVVKMASASGILLLVGFIPAAACRLIPKHPLSALCCYDKGDMSGLWGFAR